MNEKAREFRIGNVVQDDSGIEYYVNQIWKGGAELSDEKDGSGDIDFRNDEIFGIPITSSRLKAAGFHYDHNSSLWYISEGLMAFDIIDNTIAVQGEWLNVKVNYIHQLQNLFFALTGTELNFHTST